MDRLFTRCVFLLFLALAGSVNAIAQIITITNVDPGPYGQGSSIMAKINIGSGCLRPGNKFNLYLSDANGTFSGTGTLIGSFDGFYATFVNGVIPADAAPGTGYRLRVQSTTQGITSSSSSPFTINATPGVPINITANSYLNTSNTEVFGQCDNTTQGNATTPYSLTNGTAASVTAVITNEIDNSDVTNITFSTPDQGFNARAAHYTVATKAVAGNGNISTKGYLLVNNRVSLNAFKISEIGTACLPNNGAISFSVDISNGTGSIRNAFPGNIYTVAWDDGTSSSFPVCDIIANNGIISHTYTSSSCGNIIRVGETTFYNSYGLTIRAANQYCNNLAGASIAPVKVLAPALTNFGVSGLPDGVSLVACTGVVNFKNISDPGDNPSSNVDNCKNITARYNWYVNDVLFASNKGLGEAISYNFTAPGTYTVKLVLLSGSGCQNDPNDPTNFRVKQICIQNPPQADFTINGQSSNINVCAPTTLTPVNTSVIDESCQAVTAAWSVVDGPTGGFTFTGPINSATNPPQINFTLPGVYTVRLRLSSGVCAVSTKDLIVTVSTSPVAELSPNISICGGGNGQIVYSNNSSSDFYAQLEGTANEGPATYTWNVDVVSGSINPTISNPNAKYPTINYTGTGVIRVRVIHANDCSTAQDEQIITVENSPVVDAGTYATACPNTPIQLNGTVTPADFQSARWLGGTGTFAPSRNSLNPQYTPSDDEANAGRVELTLEVTTNLTGNCRIITQPVTINIQPLNPVTSASEIERCSDRPIGYNITSALAGSNFTWTIDANPNVSITAAGASGTQINDRITNTHPNGLDVVVVYRITPELAGCFGEPFELKVTVSADVPPTAEVVGDPFRCGSSSVTFNNTTPSRTGIFKWDWNDGSALEETSASPVSHTFAPNTDGSDRIYNVRLIHENACGQQTSQVIPITIKPALPVARIGQPTRSSDCGTFDLTVTNLSLGNEKEYEFRLEDEMGNLVPATIATSGSSITHTDHSSVTFTIVPAGNATYYVNMIATNDCDARAAIPNRWPIVVSTSGISSMNLFPDRACQGAPVTFQNNSTGTRFTYRIYNSTGTQVDEFQVDNTGAHVYNGFTQPGNYTVTITAASGNCGDASASAPVAIEIIESPDVNFIYDLVNCDNQVYDFTPQGILSSNYIYEWNFGDGTTSNEQDPAPHTYASAGTYTVTLNVRNQLGCAQPVLSRQIAVQPRLVADFTVIPGQEIFIPNYHFSFRDNTAGNPISWQWSFGNGATSNLPNPEYTYPSTDIGSHEVVLTVTSRAPNGTTCTSTVQKTVTISGTPGTLFLPNAFIPGNSSATLQTFMAKGSGIKTWHMQIFNKWGQLVWETNKLGANGDPIEGWDGTFKGSPAPQGAYVWQVSATFINGTQWKGMSYNNAPPKRSGVLNLIR